MDGWQDVMKQSNPTQLLGAGGRDNNYRYYCTHLKKSLIFCMCFTLKGVPPCDGLNNMHMYVMYLHLLAAKEAF